MIVAASAFLNCPKPHNTPMPAEHHSVAAVFSPRTFIPSRMMTPAPRKPIPETICAAIRPGLSGDVVMELRIKTAAPVATSALVRNPAIR